jgi:hypothetical protein
VSLLFGLGMLTEGAGAVRRAWDAAGRPGRPRIATGRYVCLGPGADRVAEEYLRHYYGRDALAIALPDTLTTPGHLRDELDRLAGAGVTDLVLHPCSAQRAQVARVAEAAGVSHPAGVTRAVRGAA